MFAQAARGSLPALAECGRTMQDRPDPTPGQQTRALGLSTVAFVVCFAVWTIFSIIGQQIRTDLGLNDTQFGILVATPVLAGGSFTVSIAYVSRWYSTEHQGAAFGIFGIGNVGSSFTAFGAPYILVA